LGPPLNAFRPPINAGDNPLTPPAPPLTRSPTVLTSPTHRRTRFGRPPHSPRDSPHRQVPAPHPAGSPRSILASARSLRAIASATSWPLAINAPALHRHRVAPAAHGERPSGRVRETPARGRERPISVKRAGVSADVPHLYSSGTTYSTQKSASERAQCAEFVARPRVPLILATTFVRARSQPARTPRARERETHHPRFRRKTARLTPTRDGRRTVLSLHGTPQQRQDESAGRRYGSLSA
jgi:hypothetical protein